MYERLSSKETKRKVEKLLAQNFERGLNAFIRDFDRIIEFFFQANIIDKNKAELAAFIGNNKKAFFPQVLPLPSRVCMVVESTTSGTYIDKPILLAVDAALSMASIGSTSFKLKAIEVQNITAQSIATLSMFHQIYDKERLARKPGLIRRHVLASSLYLTGRNVITSISKPHNYEQIELPWGMAVQLFKYHIMSKLFKRGYTANEALAAVYQNVLNETPNPMLVEIFDELIAQSNGGRGPACIFGRNPTLQRGSTQMFYIGTIKTNTRDNTISMSVLCLKAPNADFDGDQLNLTLLTDNQLTAAASRLAPHLWVWSLETPHEISGNLEIQGPVIETAANWITRARLAAKAKREGIAA
ncbi:Bifunctional DNA-directed RNA polymerase subunit beta-beta' [compost metagenome]